jgi:hypothetical protein
MMNDPIDERLARRAAAVAMADVRTVRRVLRGEPVRGFVGLRIREAVERLRRVQTAATPPPSGSAREAEVQSRSR